MRTVSSCLAVVEAQRGHLFPWTPVFFATGIGLYFALPQEPDLLFWLGVVGATIVLAALLATVWRGQLVPAVFIFLLLGFAAAGYRSQSVAEPVLGFRYYGPVEGRIVGIDRSASDKLRLTLDQVVLSRVGPDKTPRKVRISLHGDQSYIKAEPGRIVGVTAHLTPPNGPVEPGGFDFRRQAWFQGLGAVGYARTPAVSLAPAQTDPALWLWRLRMLISQDIKSRLPGTVGGVAAAITVGDRSGIPSEVMEDLRAANLAHLLAISGLHMGLLTGFVFASLRFGLATIPWVALRINTKKIAAIVALGAGAVYLALSGGNVATERAFVMVAVMLVAVLFDRRALSLRSVAMAALIVLALRPEVLTGPGFQMSFAATTALVAAFGWLRDRSVFYQKVPRWAQGAVALIMSSLVAGLATAPIAAAHFNQVPHYGLIANLLSVPLMGSLVMPAAVLAALLAPFGLHGIGLWIMDAPLRWIVAVAAEVASWDGALSFVQAPPPATLPLIALGGLIVVLWRHFTRALGLVVVGLGVMLWVGTERPEILVSSSGGLVGVMGGEGRALSKPRGDGFAARSWLENDGDPVGQQVAADRGGLNGERGARAFVVGAATGLHFTGRGAADRAIAGCQDADIVVVSVTIAVDGPCTLLDQKTLRSTGAIALYREGSGFRVVTAAERAGRRIWNTAGQ